MKRITIYFLIMHTVMLLIMAFGVWFVLNKFFPAIMIEHYFIIPLFFYLIGLIYISRFRRTPLNQPKKMVNLYMLMRMIKILLSVGVILLYWVLDKPNIRNFAIIFVVFYLINLIWETYIYMRMELYLKRKSEELHSPQKPIDQ